MAKKKGKNRVLSRQQFIRQFCNKCNICLEPSNASFCYDAMYKFEPKKFASKAWPVLQAYNKWPKHWYRQLELIDKAFCKTKVCDAYTSNVSSRDRCRHINSCVEAFDFQITNSIEDYFALGLHDDNIHDDFYYNSSYKTGKSKDKTAKPLFITNGGEEWENFMKKILNNEHNDI